MGDKFISKYEDLRDILILMQYSNLHKDWNTEDICKCILVPVMLNQYKVVRKKNELVMFASWAFPTDKQVDEYVRKLSFPHEGYQGDGKDIWLVDFIAKKGYTRIGFLILKKMLTKMGFRKAFWFRPETKKLGWHTWKGA